MNSITSAEIHHRRDLPELLAPAGEADAAYAAFHYGADAVYAGLKRFSARAEAVNLDLKELCRITAYAHSLTPRRRVYAALNTLILQRELGDLVEALAEISQSGVDAVIVQDLGVARVIRTYFPALAIHASTQLAIHNLAGAQTVKTLGARRVTLARELTLAEIRRISADAGIETEVFVHGALCYSYSGLCLFSSLLGGRSGNRGKCQYPCREIFQPLQDEASEARLPFSMKDLSLAQHIPALREAGVSSLKIEGRKKGPLYVAATTAFYRGILDGTLTGPKMAELEADLKTIFSRPSTGLYFRSQHNPSVVDPVWTGHRGVPIGAVTAVERRGKAPPRVKFTTDRELEIHDGLQIDLPEAARPFGFAVDALWLYPAERSAPAHRVIKAPRKATVGVELPQGYATILEGARIYCSSSQAVKRRFPYDRPRPGAPCERRPVNMAITVTEQAIAVEASLDAPEGAIAAHTAPLPCSGQPARQPGELEQAARKAFEKLGKTEFILNYLSYSNPAHIFVPLSLLNETRRKVFADLEAMLKAKHLSRVSSVKGEVLAPEGGACARPPSSPVWSVKIGRLALLAAFEAEDWAHVGEVVIDIGVEPLKALLSGLDGWSQRVGRDHLRLALPTIMRAQEEGGLKQKIDGLRAAGWNRWEASNLSAWSLLGAEIDGKPPPCSEFLTSGWACYADNRQAVLQLFEMGISRVTASPENDRENLLSLLREFGSRMTVVVYQDTPLCISEACHEAGRSACPDHGSCGPSLKRMRSRRDHEILVIGEACRTTIVGAAPLCLAAVIPELLEAGALHLRADFMCRPYSPQQVRDLWRELQASRAPSGTHMGNYRRGLM
jgi:U32 family peptidase